MTLGRQNLKSKQKQTRHLPHQQGMMLNAIPKLSKRDGLATRRWWWATCQEPPINQDATEDPTKPCEGHEFPQHEFNTSLSWLTQWALEPKWKNKLKGPTQLSWEFNKGHDTVKNPATKNASNCYFAKCWLQNNRKTKG